LTALYNKALERPTVAIVANTEALQRVALRRYHDSSLKTLRGLAPYEHVCQVWTTEPDWFRLHRLQYTLGLNTLPPQYPDLGESPRRTLPSPPSWEFPIHFHREPLYS
jgi:hypothetical protein